MAKAPVRPRPAWTEPLLLPGASRALDGAAGLRWADGQR